MQATDAGQQVREPHGVHLHCNAWPAIGVFAAALHSAPAGPSSPCIAAQARTGACRAEGVWQGTGAACAGRRRARRRGQRRKLPAGQEGRGQAGAGGGGQQGAGLQCCSLPAPGSGSARCGRPHDGPRMRAGSAAGSGGGRRARRAARAAAGGRPGPHRLCAGAPPRPGCRACGPAAPCCAAPASAPNGVQPGAAVF